MPTIKFNADFTPIEISILSHTWATNCADLGLANKAFRASVSKNFFESPRLYARVAMPDPARFVVEMNSNKFNLFDATASLGHETIHMRQHLNRDLVDTDDGVKWKNAIYPGFLLPFLGNDVPWEKEAWEEMGKLHKHAFACLSPDQQRLVDIKQSNGLDKTWDENYHTWRD